MLGPAGAYPSTLALSRLATVAWGAAGKKDPALNAQAIGLSAPAATVPAFMKILSHGSYDSKNPAPRGWTPPPPPPADLKS